MYDLGLLVAYLHKKDATLFNSRMREYIYSAILLFANCFYLATEHLPLFGERVYAGENGPTIPQLEYAFFVEKTYEKVVESIEIPVLDEVLDIIRDTSLVQFLNFSHNKDSVWFATAPGKEIPINLMENFAYKHLNQESSNGTNARIS